MAQESSKWHDVIANTSWMYLEGFKRIGLIDGEQLVDILTEEYDQMYDRLPAEVREKLGLRRALIPD